jgi:Fic family protein
MVRKPEPAPQGEPPLELLHQFLRSWMTGDGSAPLVQLITRANHEYLYWDRFKQFAMPEGVSSEDAWRLLKTVRAMSRRSTPVRDTHGHAFWFGMTEEMERCLHVTTRQAAAGPVIAPHETLLGSDDRRRYMISSLMEEAIASSQMEGASTTRRVAKEMLRTARTPETRAERMILNNYATIQALRELTDEPLTPEVVVRIQQWLTEGTLDDPGDVGRLRTTDDVFVYAGESLEPAHVPPPSSSLPAELDRLCMYANEADNDGEPFEHPIIKAIVLHFWLAYLHPFADGNGRTARALFYLQMLKGGYWLFEFVSISRVILGKRGQYDRAYLYSEADGCDMGYFVTFHLHAIESALVSLWEYIERQAKEDAALSATLGRDRSINHRQRALLGRALEEPHTVFTVESHKASHGVAYATARDDLLDLVERGFLEKGRQGRKWVFVAAQDLRERVGGRGR